MLEIKKKINYYKMQINYRLKCENDDNLSFSFNSIFVEIRSFAWQFIENNNKLIRIRYGFI